MAASNLNLGKASGGVLNIQPADGTTTTSLVLPASGTVVATDVAVTDNAIARYDGTTGQVQNSGVIIDDNGHLGIGSTPLAKLSTIAANNSIAETMFMVGILGVTDGFTVSKDSVANPKYTFHTTSGAIGVEIDSSGGVLLKSGTGALGYGTGAGGTATQPPSDGFGGIGKGSRVTLNKPNGQIIMNNAALAAGASVFFPVYNNLVTTSDHIVLTMGGSTTNTNYTVFPTFSTNNGIFYIMVKNISAVSLSEALVINFSVIKGAQL